MSSALTNKLIAMILSLSMLLVPGRAKAQYGDIGATKGQVVGIIVALVAVGAAIGVGAYLLTTRRPAISGCTASASGNLTLLNEADHQTYTLSGDISSITADERVRVSGKKQKNPAVGTRVFRVNKLVKDYGPCNATQSSAFPQGPARSSSGKESR